MYEEALQETSNAIRERNGLKQQCTAAIRQWDSALRERNEYKEAHGKVHFISMLSIFVNCDLFHLAVFHAVVIKLLSIEKQSGVGHNTFSFLKNRFSNNMKKL